jgi:hypothetical protein
VRALSVVLAGSVVLVGGTATAYACSCVEVGEANPRAMFRDYAVIVRVRVVSVAPTAPPPSMGDLPERFWPERVTFVAERVWKGPKKREFEATTDAPLSTCGYRFVAGERYLIYSKTETLPADDCAPIYQGGEARKHADALNRVAGKAVWQPAAERER